MITFAQPWLLAALVLPVAILAAVLFAASRRRAVGRVLGGPPRLRAGRRQRLRIALGVLVTAAAVLAVLAAARPQWGEQESALTQRGIDLIVALDVSRSMEAEDVTPSRARAAASGIGEMLSHMTGNRVGLVVFAGDAFARAPLTVDLPVVSSLVARAQVESPLVRPGTNLREALAEAFRLLEVPDAARTRAVLLVSDGEDLDGGYQDAVDFAERRGIRIYTVFAGTTNPTPLPEASGGTDVSIAQPELLAAIADETGGLHREVDRIPGLAVEFRRLQQTQFEEGETTAPIERFAWFAGAAAVLLLAVALLGEGAATRLPRLRRGVITAALAVLAAVLVAGCGAAAWQEVRAGNDAYAAGRFEEALERYRRAADLRPEDPAINYNIANALHRLGLMGDAQATAAQARALAEAAGDAEVARLALYTLGNTHFVAGNLEAAGEAYRGALRIDSNDRDAKANLELVLRLLTPPEEPEEEPPPPGPGSEEGAEGEGEGGGDQPPGEEGEGPADGEAEGQTPQPGSSGEQPGSGPDQPVPGAGAGGSEGAPTGAGALTLEDAQAALEEALRELGPEVTLEDALRLLELARQANELRPLPGRRGSGVPPR